MLDPCSAGTREKGLRRAKIPAVFTSWRPKPLFGVREPFHHPDWLFDLEHNSRAVALVAHTDLLQLDERAPQGAPGGDTP